MRCGRGGLSLEVSLSKGQLLSLALVTPQHRSPCEGCPLSGDVYWQGQEEGRAPSLCLEAVYFKVCCCFCAGALVFNIEKIMNVDTHVICLGLLQDTFFWVESRTPVQPKCCCDIASSCYLRLSLCWSITVIVQLSPATPAPLCRRCVPWAAAQPPALGASIFWQKWRLDL